MVRRTAAALIVLATLLTGCAERAASDSGTAFVAGDGSIVILDPGERAPAPAFGGPTLDGSTYDSTEHLGEVQVVNVWASWCAPCRAEAPDLVSIATESAPRGVQFVGLNTRDSQTAAKAFVRRFAVPYPNVIDRDGEIQLAFRDTLPPQAIPSTLVIDRQGRVAARILGSVSPADLRGVIDDVAAEPTR